MVGRNLKYDKGIFLLVLVLIPYTQNLFIIQQSNLTWGVSVDDEFQYMYSSTTPGNPDNSLEVSVIIDHLPIIDQNPQNMSQIPIIEVEVYFQNSSKWNLPPNMLEFLYSWAVPIGDWALLSTFIETYNNSFSSLSVNEMDDCWRYNFIYDSNSSNQSYDIAILYQIDDGMLFSYEMRLEERISQDFIEEVRFERVLEYPDIRYQYFIYIGITLICLVVVIKLAKKHL